MIQKFSFGDSLLCDLEILLPKKLNVEKAIGLAKRFPQLELSDSTMLDKLREECLDYILSPTDLPTPVEYTAADKTQKPPSRQILVGSWENGFVEWTAEISYFV